MQRSSCMFSQLVLVFFFVSGDDYHCVQSNFLLSASMDKTVRLWHVTKAKCLSLYQHSDFVTAVAFHPNV
jgi:WD40 repeat protein